MTLASDLVFRIIVSGAYLILFEVGIPNLVSGCILGWRSDAYHFWVTVTVTSDLVLRKIVSGAYPLYYPKFGVWIYLGMTECCVPYLGQCNLDL